MDVRILVVEDDPKIASFVAGGLRQHGFAVDPARDGDEALALTTTTTYDAAVVDVMLPRLDGLSLVRRLRAGRNALPVLFLSARSSVDDRISGLQAGGDDYLTKPFAFSELLARLHRGPSPAEIYAAYNIGLRGFARRGFRLDRCPRVTRDRAAVVAAGVSRRMWALDNAELDRRFNVLVAEGERLRIRKGGAR